MSKNDLMEITISEVHNAMLIGELTCKELCEFYLDRIEKYDKKGPSLNSIILVNPNALKEAEQMDLYMKEYGKLSGPLHGIPVMLKDNVQTEDMVTTAGSIALESFQPDEDAFITKKLREAGAIILAKTNLHEFAIWGETISSIQGQTLNPYDLTRTPGGSSGGTGAAIAANFGIIGIGTDTINSVRSPSSANSLVGIRPTIGLVSREGIVPYSLTQDTAGPICRTVEDAVRTLDVLAGYDANDDITAWSVTRVPNSYMDSLKTDGLKEKRIGILNSFFGKEEYNEVVNEIIYDTYRFFEEGGATLIEIEEDIDSGWLTSQVSVHLDDFRAHLDTYLDKWKDVIPYSSMAEILESGKYHPVDQENMKTAMKLNIGTPEYNQKAIRQEKTKTRILKIMADYNLDAIIYPHQQQLVCKVGDSQKQRNGVLCSVTGFPSIAVPAGFASDENAPIGVPVGLEIIGRPFSEATLIEIAYSFEQLSKLRKAPLGFE